MLFNRKNKFKKNIRHYRRVPPSWKSFKTQKRRASFRRGPLMNIRTPRLVVSELRLAALRITYNTLFLLLAVGIIYFLFFSEWLEINNVMVEGNKITDKKLILDAVEPFLHEKTFFILPSNNFFFIPTSRVEKEIKNEFKRISKVEVSRRFPTSLAIRIEEKKAVLLFCSTDCVWVDEEGFAYNKSSYAEAVANSGDVIIVQDNSHSELSLGGVVTDPAYVDFANRLWRSFPEQVGKELQYLSTPLPSAQEVRSHTKDGWVVYFDTTLDLDKNLALLNRVLDQELKDREGGATCLDYIDLRVVDRVFYKMKENCSGGGEANQNSEEANSENTDRQVDQGVEVKEIKPDANTKPKSDKKKGKKKKKN